LGVEEAPAGILQATTSMKDAGPDFGAACNRELFSAHCEFDGMTHLSGSSSKLTPVILVGLLLVKLPRPPWGDSLDTPETGITPEECAQLLLF
jgi:hypothetical protein